MLSKIKNTLDPLGLPLPFLETFLAANQPLGSKLRIETKTQPVPVSHNGFTNNCLTTYLRRIKKGERQNKKCDLQSH